MVATEKPCRGRPRAFDADAGLDLALRAFAERGFDGVSIADLCAILGVKPPSLYAAYGSKRDLFDRALARYGEATTAVYDAAIAQAVDLPDLRRRMLTTALDFYLKDGGLGCLVLGTLGSTTDAALREGLAAALARRRASVVARAMALGADPEEAEAEGVAISVGMMGLSAAARAGTDAAALRKALARLS